MDAENSGVNWSNYRKNKCYRDSGEFKKNSGKSGIWRAFERRTRLELPKNKVRTLEPYIRCSIYYEVFISPNWTFSSRNRTILVQKSVTSTVNVTELKQGARYINRKINFISRIGFGATIQRPVIYEIKPSFPTDMFSIYAQQLNLSVRNDPTGVFYDVHF